MKTALVQTSFWKDEEVYGLNIDTKLLHLFLMTSPERNCTRFYHCPDRLISAYIGLTNEALNLCKKQLELAALVYFKDGWIIIGDDSYVKPTKGKLSQKLFEDDLSKVPAHVIDFAKTFKLDCSGATQEHNNNNNNNNSNKAKNKNKNNDNNKSIGLSKPTLGALKNVGS